MPRDSNGSYSLPNGTLVNSGDTIQPSQHNPAMQDIASGISSSLSRDGLGGMRNNLDMGGFKVANAANGSADGDLATMAQLNAIGAQTPFGVPMPFLGVAPPAGFLLCFGQEISRTTYAALFAAIGTIGGPGNGTTTFNMPDLRGRVLAGKDDMGGLSALRLSDYAGTTLGAGIGSQSHTLTIGQMPGHTHGVNDPGHQHSYTVVSGVGGINSGSGLGQTVAGTASSTTGITLNDAGGGGAHPNVQPSIIVNWIMRAL